VNVVCCQVKVSATGRSLDQRSPTWRGMTESDVETSTMWRRKPTYYCCATRNKIHPLHTWFLVALCPFPEANQSLSDVYILIRLVPCGHIIVQEPNSSMRIYLQIHPIAATLGTSVTDYGGCDCCRDVRNKFQP